MWARSRKRRMAMAESWTVDWIRSSDPSKGTTHGSWPGTGRGSEKMLIGPPSAAPLSEARSAYWFARCARSPRNPPEGLGHAVDAEADQPSRRQQAPHGHARLDELDALLVAEVADEDERPQQAPQDPAHRLVR